MYKGDTMERLNEASTDLKEAIDNYLYSRDDTHTDKEIIALADEMLIKMLDYVRVINDIALATRDSIQDMKQ